VSHIQSNFQEEQDYKEGSFLTSKINKKISLSSPSVIRMRYMLDPFIFCLITDFVTSMFFPYFGSSSHIGVNFWDFENVILTTTITQSIIFYFNFNKSC
jgi:hypothetical protein